MITICGCRKTNESTAQVHRVTYKDGKVRDFLTEIEARAEVRVRGGVYTVTNGRSPKM